MSENTKRVGRAVSLVAKLLTSLLWVGIAAAGAAAGQPVAAVFAAVYLVYLWVFDGRWLIY